MKLSNTVAYDYPSINALADHILELRNKTPQRTSIHPTPSPDRAVAIFER